MEFFGLILKCLDVTERVKREAFASVEYRVNKALFSVELLRVVR